MGSRGNPQVQEPKWTAFVLCLAGIASRLIPHLHNFTAVGAASLFAGARLRRKTALAVPVLILLCTDPVLAYFLGYPSFTLITLFVAAGFLVNVLIGRGAVASTENPVRIGLAALICSTQFFLITNLGVWLTLGTYPRTREGLVACYVAGIPFFGRMMLADLVYAGVFFGLDGLVRKWRSRTPGTSVLPIR